ncbi:MAG: hypothetical protein GXP58_01180 [Deltaproteobacteria bacterium]|nr:hypothetical protein [Deltaproteobacteria bacterium]
MKKGRKRMAAAGMALLVTFMIGGCRVWGRSHHDHHTYTVGGTVTGLGTPDTVVLQDNSGDDLSVTTDGTFIFGTSIANGSRYEVTVKTQPTGQTCTVASGSGTVSAKKVTDVAVTCVNNTYTVGGTVSGLSGTVVLQDNGGDDLSVTANSTFTFTTSVAHGNTYAVTVSAQPSGQLCTVASGSGTMGSANVTGVAVTCSSTIAVSGTVEDSDSGNLIANVTIAARDASDNTMATATTDSSGAFSLSVPSGQDFYLHADGVSIGNTTYVPDNKQIDNRTSDLTGVKLYLTDSIMVATVAGLIGADSNADAFFNWDVEDTNGAIDGVTATASSPEAVILYTQTDGTYTQTGPTTTGGGVIGYLPNPGENSTVTFTQTPDKATAGYSVDTTFKLRLIPGEFSSPYEP